MKIQVTADEVRQWARARGMEVGNRGHLPKTVIKAFNHRHHKRVFISSNPWENDTSSSPAEVTG